MARPRPTPTPPPVGAAWRPPRQRNQGILGLVTRVQPRDIQILLDLYDKRVLTTHQIADLFFTARRTARGRLLNLHRCRLVERFRPRLEAGSAPEHYLLGKTGAEIVAAHLGLELKEIYDKDRAARLAYSPLLHHLVAVNTFYSRLVLACRKREGHRVEWWGEARIRRRWGSMVVPDGFGYIETPGRALSVFLELDLGTEPLGRLTRKLTGYSMAARTDDAPDLLLFCFPSPAREAHARKVLSSVGITTVTSQLELHKSGALEDIWLPLQSQTRYSLLEVPLGATPVGSRKAGVEL